MKFVQRLSLMSLILFLSLVSSSIIQANERILVVRSVGANFSETFKGLKDDLGDDVSFIDKTVDDDISTETMARYLRESKPALVVFLGNKPLNAYGKYQQQYSQDPQHSFPPAIVLSALYLDRQLRPLKNTTGIRYEIPAVTSLVQLRSIVKRPIKKVGVIYREWMGDFIAQNQVYCEQEGIELVMLKIHNKVSINYLNYHLKYLLRKDIDALWVVNDNGLLQPRFLQNAWLPLLKKFNKPVLVGLSSLVKTDLNFGTFSVEADHYALGVQGAEMIDEIMENGWQINDHSVEQPLSINNILNVKLSKKKRIGLETNKLGQIDRLIR